MLPEALLRMLRGRASFRFRGDLYYARPLATVAAFWAALVCYRATDEGIDPVFAVGSLVGTAAWLTLCRRAGDKAPARKPAPSLYRTTGRILVLMAAMGLAQPLFAWLTNHHD